MSYKKGPVITEELANSLIRSVEFHLIDGTTSMTCALNLWNGFTVIGTSACLSTTTFDPQIGMRWSKQSAVTKLMELLAFMAADQLSTNAASQAISKTLSALKES